MGLAQDGYDTIEWAARQTWAKGKVGMHGGAFKLAFAFGWGSVRMPNRIMNPQRCQLLARHQRRGAARGRAGPLLQPGRCPARGDGQRRSAAPAEARQDGYHDDPRNPVPTLGGNGPVYGSRPARLNSYI